MGKTFLKDSVREIKKNFSRFLSLLLIIAIGTAFFIGVKITGPDMLYSADTYFDSNDLMDIQIISKTFFSPNDIENIKQINGVEVVNPVYTIDGIVTTSLGSYVVRVYSYENRPDYLNRPVLIEGRLPEAPNECVIEKSTIFGANMNIGTEISLNNGTVLKNSTFTIVGIVSSPLYISEERGTSSLGNGRVELFMMISENAFNIPLFILINISLTGAKEKDTYSKQYEELVEGVKQEINKLNESWYVLGRDANSGYMDYKNSADRMDAIATVFPVIFILVAYLISFTSMTRLVQEERTEIGTLKALGYKNGTIACKFLLFATLASILGGILGILIGFYFFPALLFNAFSILYTLPKFYQQFDILFAGLSQLAGILVTCGSSMIVLFRELPQNAATLMRPKAPKPGKKVLLEKIPVLWNLLSFTRKVTLRNLFRYKSRFFMTLSGVTLCTALLLVGFGLKDSIDAIGYKQYGDIYLYQLQVEINEINPEILDNLSSKPYYIDSLLFHYKNIKINSDSTFKNATIIVPESDIANLIVLKERVTQKEVSLTSDGAVITEKLALMLNVGIGGYISFENSNVKVKITGIVENYLLHNVYLSKTLYQSIFGCEVTYNQLNVKLLAIDKDTETALAGDLMKIRGVSSLLFTRELLDTFNDMMGSVNYIVLVLIVSAALLSFIVLFTLTSINVSERKREIATIKVLGFYDHEVTSYVYRENIVITILSIILGLFFGTFLAQYIITTAEVEMVMFGRTIHNESYLYSGILTLIFSLLVNLSMLKVLAKIDMVEALKSIE